MLFDNLKYVIWLHKLIIDVCIANQRKNIWVCLHFTLSMQNNFEALN